MYKYSRNQKEELVYSADGSLNQRDLSVPDAKGNEIEETIFEVSGVKVCSKHSYTYEFDPKRELDKANEFKMGDVGWPLLL